MTLDLVVSHYRVLEAIGEGGMGEVYLGVDETLRRKVALKAIKPEHRLDAAAKARFLREARTLSQLDHPNICRVYDYIETADRDWIVLELVEGQTLATVIRATSLDRLRIARQIAAVLVATHAAGVVHRDLKPGNVMLTSSGDVKVLDFGLSAVAGLDHDAPLATASAATGTPAITASPLDETRLPETMAGPSSRVVDLSQFRSEAGIKGTAAYMSPEQARGEAATAASDMYSFGLLVQELFTGQHPYGAIGNYHDVLDKAARGESLPPVGLPAPLAALVIRLKSLAPSQRPTAVDTLERLNWVADRPRRRRRNLLAAGLVLAAALGAAKYTVDLSRERNAALLALDEAQRRRSQAEGLISFMVGDLRTKLTAVGRLELLDDVGKQALAYFASVPAATLTDEELFRQSQALHQLGQVRQARADLPGALNAYEDSLAQAEALVKRRPENAEWQLGLGTSHFYAGDLKMRGGDLPAALAHFQAYQRIAEALVARDPANFEWQLELSYGHSNVAAIYQRQGDLAAARDQLEIVARLHVELAKRKPSDTTLQASRANNFNRLGIVQDALGDLGAAAATFQRELEIYAELLAADARNMRIRRRMEVGHIYRSLVLRAMGLPDEARRHLDIAFREAKALIALDPTNADWQRDVASAGNALARLDLDEGRPGRARDRYRAAIAIFTMLAKKNPTRSGEIRDLGRTYAGLAEALRRDRNTVAANREIDSALALLRPLAEQHPNDVEISRDLALAENERGLISAALGRGADARRAWTHAAALLEPRAVNSRDRSVLDPWVRALVYLGRTDEAKAGFDRLAAIGYRDRSFMTLWPLRP